MAPLGVRSIEELIGRTELLQTERRRGALEGAGDRPDAAALRARRTWSPRRRAAACAAPTRCSTTRSTWTCSSSAAPRIEQGTPVRLERRIENKNRAVGGLLSGEIARVHGEDGLPDGSVQVHLTGSAGQSFGAWLARGVELVLDGDANDYCGKGLSGGTIVVRPPADATFAGRAQRDRRQHRPLRRHLRPRLLPRARRRALRRPQLRRRDRGGGSGRPRLRVHDRRPRGRARPHRAQLRRRHERRHRLRARRRRRLPRALQHRAGGLRRHHPGRERGAARLGRGAPRPHRLAGGRPPARRLAGARSTRSSRSCRTTTSARSPSSSPPRARPRWRPRRPAPPRRRATPPEGPI